MNRKRVQMLRDMMEGIPDKQVNLDFYFIRNGDPCETIACIAGWAAIYPPFIKQGLQKKTEHGFTLPYFAGFFGKEAAAKFFDVSPATFSLRQIFCSNITQKKEALKRLDALLATGTDDQRSAVE